MAYSFALPVHDLHKRVNFAGTLSVIGMAFGYIGTAALYALDALKNGIAGRLELRSSNPQRTK